MKKLNRYITENKKEDLVRSATNTLVKKFGFRKVRRGVEEGVEKDGKYCKVQVCEMPYDSCIVVDSKRLFTEHPVFDYWVYIDTRKKFQDRVYIIEIDDLMDFIKQYHEKKTIMWPTTNAERGTDKINPLGVTIKVHALKGIGDYTEVGPEISPAAPHIDPDDPFSAGWNY